MPVIPTFAVEARPQPQAVARMPVELAGQQGQQRAQAGAQAVDAISRFAQLEAATARARQVEVTEAAKAEFATGLADLRGRVERTPDTSALRRDLGLPDAADPSSDNLADVWTLATNQVRDRIAGNMSGRARDMFAREATQQSVRDRLDMVRLDAKRLSDRSRAELDRSLDQFALSYAGAGNEADRSRSTAEAMAAIAAREQAGSLSAVDAEKMRQGWRGRQQRAEIMRLTAQDPNAALAALANPQRFPDVDPVVQAQLANAASQRLTASATAGMAAEMRATRAAQQRADVATNELVERIELSRRGDGGPVSLEDLRPYRDVLPGASYRVLAEAIREGNGPGAKPGDAGTLLDLERRAETETPDVFARGVDGAVRGGQISATTGADMLRRNLAASRRDMPPPPIQSGRSFVRESLEPGDAAFVNMPGVKEQYQQRQLNAMSDYDRWARANPQATAEQSEAAARGIVQRFRDQNPAALRQTLPRPYGFSGANTQVNEDALRSAATRLLEAARAGRIGGAELVNEERAIAAWREVLSAGGSMPAPASGASSGRGQGANTAPRGR